MERIGETDTKPKGMNLTTIEVGVLFAPTIRFRLNGIFRHQGRAYHGEYSAAKAEGKIWLTGPDGERQEAAAGLTLEPDDYAAADFDLLGVTIGIHFHWERQENQKFKGSLRIIDEGEHLTAVNLLPVEEYLTSVISSEMKATSHPELLKAHAIISRSWLLAQKAKKAARPTARPAHRDEGEELVRWFDREDHEHFDVCADDHCQRYQGISRAYTPAVQEAIEATRGQVLTFDGAICDTRFSKCCGGVTERFENTWEETPHPYLTRVEDGAACPGDLRREEDARRWILDSPPSLCNTDDRATLANVLNDYDQETTDFFRWTVSYTAEELSALVREKSGIDFGRVVALEAVERGVSGRIVRLRVAGTRRTMVVGKELLIRKLLSPSHLYSSAFVVDTETDSEGLPARFTLRGAGWGHGVGLCQIGAAVMSARGRSHQEILAHYFPGAKIENTSNLKE